MIEESKGIKDLQNDFKQAKSAKTEIDDLINDWNDLYYGESLGNENKNKSKFIMKEVAKHIEWQKPSIMEPFTNSSTPIRVIDYKNQERGRIKQKYLNSEFTGNFDREGFMDSMTDILLREGTVWVKSGWKLVKENNRIVMDSVSMQEMLSNTKEPTNVEQNLDGTFNVEYNDEKIFSNCPTADVCKNEDCFPDPDADNLEDMRFFAFRKYKTLSDLRREGVSEETINKIYEEAQSNNSSSSLGANRESDNRAYGKESTFQTSDKARYKISIIEYWGYYDLNDDGIAEPIIAQWSEKGNVKIKLEENPFPSKEIPFYNEVYSPRPFSLWGNALAYFIGDNQVVKSGSVRGVLDNMSNANNGQKFIRRGSLDYINMKRMKDGNKHIIVNKENAIEDGSFNQIPQSVFQVIDMINRESDDLSGVSSQTQISTNNGKEDNPQMLTTSQQRMASLVRSTSSLLSKVFNHWLISAEFFLEDEQISALFTQQQVLDWNALKYSESTIIKLKVGTEVVRAQQIQQLNMLMQQAKVLGDKTPPNTISELVADMFELMDRYEKAEEIRGFQPKPDPMAVQMHQMEMQKMQLENQKIQAEIAKIQSDIQVDSMDAQTRQYDAQVGAGYKQAQSAEKYAKTEAHKVESVLKPVEIANTVNQSKQKEQNG